MRLCTSIMFTFSVPLCALRCRVVLSTPCSFNIPSQTYPLTPILVAVGPFPLLPTYLASVITNSRNRLRGFLYLSYGSGIILVLHEAACSYCVLFPGRPRVVESSWFNHAITCMSMNLSYVEKSLPRALHLAECMNSFV
ncbi:hypothetical protein BDQ17DRAFT_1344011 [Cyathus striatus]|nr:hypothetical protein BDQ17DRAFT_1344011 [Cyathus striatus]